MVTELVATQKQLENVLRQNSDMLHTITSLEIEVRIFFVCV
jgi:hypothetical protein